MAWLYLLLAGVMEICFTSCLKMSDNFQSKIWTAGFILSAVLSFYFLNKASQTIPLGVAYAVWTGIGAVGTVLTGALLFQNVFEMRQMVFVAMLLIAIIGLKCSMNEPTAPPAEVSPKIASLR